MALPVVDTRVKITLIDEMSRSLKNIQTGTDRLSNSFSSLTRAGAQFAAGFASVERALAMFGSSVEAGYNLGIKMETAQMSISGVLLSMTKLKDRNLEWNEAMDISADILDRLQKKAMITASTPTELVDTFAGLVGVGLGGGMNLEQIEKIVVVGANAVKSFGLQGYQLIQEMRDLFAGTITTRASTVARALGITNADIKRAKEAGDLYGFLMERMKGFDKVVKEFGKTYQGAQTIMLGATEQLTSQGLEPLRNAIKNVFNDITSGIISFDKEGQPQFTEQYLSFAKGIGDALADGVRAGQNLFRVFSAGVGPVLLSAQSALAPILTNLDAIISTTIAWRMHTSRVATPLKELKDVTKEIRISSREYLRELQELDGKSRKPTFPKVALLDPLKEANKELKDFISKWGILENARNRKAAAKAEKGLDEIANPIIRIDGQENKEGKRWLYGDKGVLMRATSALDDIEAYKATIKAVDVAKQTKILAAGDEYLKRYLSSIKKFKAENEEIERFNNRIEKYSGLFIKRGVSEAETTHLLSNAIKLFTAGKKEEAQAYLQAMAVRTREIASQNAEIKKQNERIAKWNKFNSAVSAVGVGMMGLGTLLERAATALEKNDSIHAQWVRSLADTTIQISSMAIAVTQATSAWNMLTAAQKAWVTSISGVLGIAGGVATAFGKIYEATNFFGTREKDEVSWWDRLTMTSKELGTKYGGKHARAYGVLGKKDIKTGTDTGELGLKYPQGLNGGVTDEEKKANNLVKLLDDAKKISADLAAKLAMRTTTKQEQEFANLNKEIATFQAKLDNLKNAGQDITELQAQLDQYNVIATQKITDQFDYLKIKWDEVIVHIKDSQVSTNSILQSGIDALSNHFVDFGQNIVTEGGNFMERLSDLFKNFANDICNSLMKIYMNALLVKAVGALTGSLFGGGGGLSTYEAGVKANALTNGFYRGNVPGHAIGGVASGWSLVGERGPELVNFSNPGRVYTAEDTRKMIGGGCNIKVNIVNNTGTQATAESNVTLDTDGYICNVVLNAVRDNRNNMRNMLKGAMA